MQGPCAETGLTVGRSVGHRMVLDALKGIWTKTKTSSYGVLQAAVRC